MVTQDGSPSLGWPPHTGYTSNRACCYSGVCHNLVSGAGWWPRPLPSSVCLTASDTLRSMAMATTRQRTNTFSGFNEAARWVGHWAPPSDAQIIQCPLALGSRRKPCGPSCITYTSGLCVRPQEMLCSSQTRSSQTRSSQTRSSQTRSRKPTDSGGTRFPVSMRSPPPRKL